MKLAFTTLGCPRWDMATIISHAVEYGFDAIDFRGYLGDMAVYNMPLFTSQAAATARRISDAGLHVSCFSTSARVAAQPAEAVEEVQRYLPLCRAFGVGMLRVFGGAIGAVPRDQARDGAVRALQTLAPLAEQAGVTLVVETHDDWVRCRDLAAVIEQANSPRVAVLWDVHHPCRMVEEQPAQTWAALGKWIRNTHWKDSRLVNPATREYQLCLTGQGDIPLAAIYNVLKAGGYDGYLTLEWEKMWHPQIEEPETAFPQFAQFMRKLMA